MSDDIYKQAQIMVSATPVVISAPRLVLETQSDDMSTLAPISVISEPPLQDELQMAQMELDAVRSEAQQLLATAEHQASQLLLAAQQRGFDAGQEAGRAAAEGEARALLLMARHVLDQTRLWQNALVSQAEINVKAMVGQAAQQLFGQGFELPPEQLQVVVARALNEARDLGKARVRLNPQDLALLQPLAPADWVMAPDSSIQRGGCLVTAENGTIDGRVETQLEDLHKQINA